MIKTTAKSTAKSAELQPKHWANGFAVIGTPDGWLVAHGPFTRAAQPDSQAAWIYWNDFEGRNPQPWLKPQSVELVDQIQIKAPAQMPDISWKPLDKSAFRHDFDRIQAQFQSGHLEKVVPAVVEQGVLQGDRQAFLQALLAHIAANRSPELFGYFIVEGDRTIGGLSPEILFESRDGRHYSTHAVAGTQKRGERSAEAFLSLQKETREHELVMRGLRADLEKIGVENLHFGPRSVRVLPTLEHLQAPISFEAAPSVALELLNQLHPTPALGVFPKSPASLEFLFSLEAALNRQSHGSPIGYWLPQTGACRFVVGIRCVQVQDRLVTLAAGCGVTDESDFDAEWVELENKRNSVKRWFAPARPHLVAEPTTFLTEGL